MAYTLQQTVNWASTYIQYSPLMAGLGQEPAVSIASEVRNAILGAPFTWSWNRAEDSTILTVVGTQDYTLPTTTFGFLEKVSLTDVDGKIYELKDIYNTAALSKTAVQGRPSAVAVITRIPNTSVTIRFMSVPEQIYRVNLTYQKAAPLFGPFLISSATTAAAGVTTYFGTFDPDAFPTGAIANVTGFVAHTGNNGSFTVVSVTTTSLSLANTAGLPETITAYVTNFDWSPIPDSYQYIYNSLFLGEAMAMVDDSRSVMYRQRGVASLLSKSEGLTETQKNAFVQQWMARGVEQSSVMLRMQQATQGRGV